MTKPAAPTFSADTLNLFAKLIAEVTLNASADDFEEWAAIVITAKRELRAAQEEGA
jgi:hypothetical protein